MLKRILLILPLLALTVALSGQDQQESTGSSENHGNRSRGGRGGSGGGGGGFEAIREAYAKVNEQLKEKMPEEYKELEKLEATDRRAAMQKRQELAKKAGIEMPSFGGGRGGRGGERRPDAASEQNNSLEEWTKAENAIKEKFPEEYAEMVKLRETDMVAALAKLRELAEKAEVKLPAGDPPGKIVAPRNVARLAVERANMILQRRYPDEYAEIVRLRDEDPELARDKFRELFRKAGLNSEELKKQVVARAASTRVIQVEVPQQNNSNNNNNNRRGQGGWGGGMGGGPPGFGR